MCEHETKNRNEPHLEVLTDLRWQEIVNEQAGLVAKPLRLRQSRRRIRPPGHVHLILDEEASGPKALHELSLLEFSSRGMMVKSYRAITPEQKVRVEIFLEKGDFLARGRIAHCTQSLGCYKIGIELVFEREENAETEENRNALGEAGAGLFGKRSPFKLRTDAE